MVATRSKPSPSGFQQLPATTRRRPQHVPTRMTPGRRVAPAADITTQPSTSQDIVASSDRIQTPPTTTSRSQSPQLDIESDSPTQVPESRSTSPPITKNNTTHTLRSQTRSVSPNATEQKSQPKRDATAPATFQHYQQPTRMAGRKRKGPELDTSEDEDVANSNSNTAVEQRRSKRSRIGERETAGVDQSLEALFADEPVGAMQALAADSSADDDTPELTHTLSSKSNRSRSTSRTLVPVVENNSEDAGSEDSSSDVQRPVGYKPLGRRSEAKMLGSRGGPLVPDDMNIRRQIVADNYGGMEIPALRKTPNGLHRSGNEYFQASDASDHESEFDIDAPSTHQSPSLYRKLIRDAKNFNKAKSSSIATPKSNHISQAGNKNGDRASSSRPRETIFRSYKIIIPSNPAHPERVLTDPRIIEPANALVLYAERNPSHRLPTQAEMKVLLTEFNAREAAKATSATASSSSQQEESEANLDKATSDQRRIDQQPLDHESGALTNELSVDEDVEEAAAPEDNSEVPIEVTEPQTPTPRTPKSGWFGGLTAIAKTATSIFSRRSQSVEAPTTNGAPVVGVANAHLIPQTSDFAYTPNTPTNTHNTTRRFPQTEARLRSSMKSRAGPQTETKRVRFGPIERRSLLTPEQIAERHREEDEDLNRRERQSRRAAMQASVEDADELDETQSVNSAQVGEKRKSRHHEFKPLPPGWFGCSYNEDDSDSSEDTEIASSSPIGSSTRPGTSTSTPSRQASAGNLFYAEEIDLTKMNPQELEAACAAMTDDQLFLSWRRVPEADRYKLSDTLPANKFSHIERYLGISMPPPPGTPTYKSSTPYKPLFGGVHTPIYMPPPDTRPKYVPPPGYELDSLNGSGNDVLGGTSTGRKFGDPNRKHNIFLGDPRPPPSAASTPPALRRAGVNRGLFASSAPSLSAPKPTSSTTPAASSNARLFDFSASAAASQPAGSEPAESQADTPSTPSSVLDTSAFTSRFTGFSSPTVHGCPDIAVLDNIFGKLKKAPNESTTAPVSSAPNSTFPASTGLSGAAAAPPPSSSFFPSSPTSSPAAPPPAVSSSSLFSRMSAPVGDDRIGTFASHAHTVEPATPEPAPEPETPSPVQAPLPEGTYGHSYGDENSPPNANNNASTTTAQSTSENAGREGTPLQTLPWTQTPPPKPKPSNAQLPQVPVQPSAADMAKAKAEKYKPVVPSKLSQSTIMTPPHADKENRVPDAHIGERQQRELFEEAKATFRKGVEEDRSRFDPEVMAAIDVAPELPAAMSPAEAEFRANLTDIRSIYNFDDEVMDEIMKQLP